MNDYGFGYINYMNNMQGNVNYPNLTQNDYSSLPQTELSLNNTNMYSLNHQKNSELLDPYQGFIRGNSFSQLYDKYKNYKPMELNPKNEREAMLYQLLQYKFALTDLNLYLDTHPNDQEMIAIFKKYLTIEKQIKERYEGMYGSLTVYDIQPNTTNWIWKNSPWPWEVI